jgi:radical SAM superfamily enzyme YgiQ (UPF0313 family)
MLNIILADLQNSYFVVTRNSVPINIGFIAEYLDAKLSREKSIFLTRKPDELLEYVESNQVDVIGFGFYSWNHGLVIKIADEIRRIKPNILIVFGGPSCNEKIELSRGIFEECQSVDYVIANEGEQPFLNLIEAYSVDSNSIRNGEVNVPGCFGRNRINGEIHGVSMDRYEGDINDIPSPYLSGRLDKFLAEPLYLPIVQTTRGCPYGCTFCVSGKRTWNKLRSFSIDRIKEEFWYIQKKSASTYLRLADENFGILPRDVEIAHLLRNMKDSTGYPDAISIYTDKHPSDRVLEINKLLSDILPFNISFQSMTEEVLTNIKRINITDDRVSVALKFAQDNDLMLVTELIFGLPGETTQSFLTSIDKAVRLRFESVLLIQLYILKGSEMDDPIHREKYGVKTKYMISENGYTEYRNIKNVEVDEWVTETNTIDAESYVEFNKIIVMFHFMHGKGHARELIFLFESLGVKPSMLLSKLSGNISNAPCFNSYANKYKDKVQHLLKETKQQAIEYAIEEMKKDDEKKLTGVLEARNDTIIDIIVDGNFKLILEEIAKCGRSLVSEEVIKGLPSDWESTYLKETIDFCCASLVDLNQNLDDISHDFNFDFEAWKLGKYYGIPQRMEKKVTHTFSVASRSTLEALTLENPGISLRNRYRKFSSITNSRTNRKRCKILNIEMVTIES